jgi:hypothetical protein
MSVTLNMSEYAYIYIYLHCVCVCVCVCVYHIDKYIRTYSLRYGCDRDGRIIVIFFFCDFSVAFLFSKIRTYVMLCMYIRTCICMRMCVCACVCV